MEHIDLYVVNSNGSYRGPLPDYRTLEFSPIFCDVGSVTMTYPSTGYDFTYLFDSIHTSGRDVEVAVRVDGVLIPSLTFVLDELDGDDAQTGSGVGVWSFTGRFIGKRLEEAVALNSGTTDSQGRVFEAATAGVIVRTLIQEAQTRGALAGITWSTFSNTLDSNGAAWAQSVSIEITPGTTILSVLKNLTELGLSEFVMDGRDLKMYNPDTMGTDRTIGATPLLFALGRDLKDSPRKVSLRQLTTALLVAGADGLYTSEVDAAAEATIGRRVEKYQSQASLTSAGAVTAYAQTKLATLNHPRMEKTHGLVFAAGSPQPVTHFGVGDWAYSDVGRGAERYRIRQWTLNRDEQGLFSGTVTLNDLFAEMELALALRLKSLEEGNSTPGTSTPVVTPTDLVDVIAPAAPGTITLSSVAYLNSAGIARSVVIADWPDVTTNSDATAIDDLDSYEVQWRYSGDPWRYTTVVTASTAAIDDLDVNRTVEFRARAKDRHGNYSAYSGTFSLLTALDTTPPPPPSDAVVTSKLSIINIAWDGLANGGGAMPADFDRLEIAFGAATNPTSVIGALRGKGALVRPDQVLGSVWHVRTRAVDRSGNASGWSADQSITVIGVDGPDIEANAITANKIAAGAVQAQHINVGAVRPTGLGFGVDELVANPVWSNAEMRSFYPPPSGWSYDTTAGHLQDGQTHVVLMPPSAAGPTMAKSYLTSVNSTASQTTYTFTGVTLGAADATRSIILIGTSRGTLGNTSVTVTVAGISATVDVFAGFEGTNNCAWIAKAEVPTGTSGTIVVTNSAAQLRTNVAVYRAVGSHLRKVDSTWAQDFGTAPTGLTVGPGGSALVFAGIYAAWNGASFTWSGDVVEDFDFSFDTYARVGGASGLNAADVTVTAATNDINKAVSVAYVPTQDTTTSMDLAQALRVAPGDKFFVRMIAKRATAATWLPRLSLGCADVDGDPVVSPYIEGDSAVPVGSYAPYEGILTVPSGSFTITPKLIAAAGTGTWVVRAVSIRRVLSSENAVGQSVEISPQGLVLRGPNDDGDPDITLGTTGTPSLVLRDGDDHPSVSIDSSGAVLANGIYAMQGLWYKGTELTDVIRQMPRGLVALGEQYFSTSGITTEYGIMEVAFESEIDRSYRVDWQMIAIGSTGTTEMGNYIRYTTDGSKPTLSSPYIRYQVQKLGAATAWETARDFFLWFPHHTGTIRLLLTAIGVNGNVSLANYQPVQFNVYDTGTTWTNVGVVNTGAAGSTSPVMRRTTVRATEWAMDYETDNSTYNVDPTRLYVGRLDAASQYTKSLMGFPDAMRTDLTGATAIHDIWVRLRNLHWYRATGGTAVLGRHVWDSQPGTATWDADALVVPMTYGQDLWVRLPDAWYNSFKTGGGKFGVALYAPTDSLDYYGYFDRAVTGQVRYRYTK